MPAFPSPCYFKQRRSFSELKQALLGSYFAGWCQRQAARATAAPDVLGLYVDLHAAAGKEGEGAEDMSLPGLLARMANYSGTGAAPKEWLRVFYEEFDKPAFGQVQEALEAQFSAEEFPYPPLPLPELANQQLFDELLQAGHPALLVLDPFHSLLAQDLLQRTASIEQADLFLLLQPATMRKALMGKKVSPPLSALFGHRLPQLQAFFKKERHSGRREAFLLNHLQELLQAQGRHTLLFQFNDPQQDQAQHYLLFASSDQAAYQHLKALVLPYSDVQDDGVALLMANQHQRHQLSLFPEQLPYSVSKLAEELAGQGATYKYKSIEKIGEVHSIGTPYHLPNYLAAFELLRAQGRIELLNPKTMQTIRTATLASIVKYKPAP